MDTTIQSSKPPKFIFIIPYRKREQHRVFFSTYILKIMEDVPKEDWTYFFVQQSDERPFNRGAMKNIGFLAIKYKYPNDYKNIIFIFNDIDTLPYDKNILDFNTTSGIIKHYYGFKFALGGIFSVTGGDFEKTSGFPNFWAWGGEDNMIHSRALSVGITIDRSVFFSLGDMNILQFADGFKRLICRDELATTLHQDNIDGLTTIKNLNYEIFDDSHFIDVTTFDSLVSPSSLYFEEQTIDRIGKIRVNNKKSSVLGNNNMLQIKHGFFNDANKPSVISRSSVDMKLMNTKPVNIIPPNINAAPKQLYIANHNPKLPFSHNDNIFARKPASNTTNTPRSPIIQGGGIGGSGIGGGNMHTMYRNTPSLPTFVPSRENIQSNFTRKTQPDPQIVIPLNRPNTTSVDTRQMTRTFGMRGLFM